MAKAPPTMSIADLERRASELLQNALILHPDVPSKFLADEIVSEADAVFVREFGRYLMTGFFNRGIHNGRAKQRHSRMPEEFRHLPLVFRIPGRKSVRFEHAMHTDVQRYYFYLGKQLDGRKKTDLRRAEAKLLMDRMRAPSRKNKGITTSEVLKLDFGDGQNGAKRP